MTCIAVSGQFVQGLFRPPHPRLTRLVAPLPQDEPVGSRLVACIGGNRPPQERSAMHACCWCCQPAQARRCPAALQSTSWQLHHRAGVVEGPRLLLACRAGQSRRNCDIRQVPVGGGQDCVGSAAQIITAPLPCTACRQKEQAQVVVPSRRAPTPSRSTSSSTPVKPCPGPDYPTTHMCARGSNTCAPH